MRNHRLLMALISCVLLVGCGQKQETAGTDISQEEIVSEKNVEDNYTAGDNANADAKDNTYNTSTITSDPLCFDDNTGMDSVCLCITDEYTINLVRYKDLESGFTNYAFEMVTDLEPDQFPRISARNLEINNEIRLVDETSLIFTENSQFNGSWFHDAKCIENNLKFSGDVPFEKLSGEIVDKGVNYDPAGEKIYEFAVDIPEEKNTEYIFTPVLGACAYTQEICADENAVVRLIGCGNFEKTYSSGFLDFVFECENLSDEVLPIYIEEIVINGTSFSVEVGDEITPGRKEFFVRKLSLSDIQAQHISSIYDLKFMVLTDAYDNRSIDNNGYRGGKLYSAKLAQTGEYYEPEFDGEPIYSFEDIDVYFIGLEPYDKYSEVYCKILINNKSDEYISFNCYDAKADGKECNIGHNLIYAYDFSYLSTGSVLGSVAPGCHKSFNIIFDGIENPAGVSSVSCDFNILTAGGAQLLDSSYIVFDK